MMRAVKNLVASAALLLSVLAPVANAASLVQITENFGPNPTKVGFYIYVPDVLAAKPAILVNPHWCHGTASAAYAGSQYATLAAKYGYIVIYPNSPNTADQCWDLSSSQTLTHNGGGDSQGIVSMVKWTLAKYNADTSRVFVTGVSSGGMMTNVLIGSYPDVFAAGSAWAGVPFGCYAAPGNNSGVYGYWNSQCATGNITHTPAEWKAIVQAAYPGYSGWRPKMQTFHGTSDETVNYVNFGEQVKEWTAVLGLSQTPVSTTLNTPLSGWTKTSYGPNGWFEAYSAAGVTHNIQVQADTVVAFFQLSCSTGCFSWGQGSPSGSAPAVSSLTTSTKLATSSSAVPSTTKISTSAASSTSPAVAITTTPSAIGQSLYGQCGGIGYTGPTACAAAKCSSYNAYYSQCVPTAV
ncbi:Alpha/Beta hydrolase protein [Cercophora scortea]|uniref:Carboxylic ester hydrolase n=1 Tax=Cercophora scortea TaxID=314031 RepID=A0AAE0M2Y3_9PEZI|nr:Alpha/Beta hydrolase protein [Cercophora scortea]